MLPGRANPGRQDWASALAGGDCMADVLRTGGTAQTLGSRLHPGVRQLDRVSRELLARVGSGPGDAPSIDLDSTICETYGLAKEGARDHGYTGKRGYHPLLAVAAGTGDVLMARLREGRANTARGAAHFLRETVGRVRYAGARGQLTVRADSGFYTHAIVAACRRMDVRFSITVRQHARLRNRGHTRAGLAHPWRAPPLWPRPATLPSRASTPLPVCWRYHAWSRGRPSAPAEIDFRDLKYGVGLNHLPSGRFPANGAWLAVQVIAHNLARWTARIGLGEQIVTTKTLRRRFFSMAGRLTRSARRLTLHLPHVGPGKPSSVAPSLDSERCLSPPDGARPPLTRHPAN